MKISPVIFNKGLVLAVLVLLCPAREAFADEAADKKCPPNPSFDHAQNLLKEKKYAEALPFYDKAIPVNVNVYSSLVGKAFCYTALGDTKSAFYNLDLAEEHDPGRPEAYHLAAKIYLAQKNYKEAIKYADESLDLRWNYKDCLKIKAMALFGDRQFDKALTFFDNAIRYNPKDSSLYFQRGLVYERMGDFAPAQKDFETLLVANPGDTAARVKLAQTYLRIGSYVKAEKFATDALNRDPKLADAFSVRAAALSGIGQFDRATTDAVQVVKLQPNDPHSYAALGELEYRNKKYDAAIADLKRCNELNPNFVHGKAHHFLAKAFQERGMLKESAAERLQAQKLGYPDVD